MGRNTKISWADHSWSPFWGCTKVSPGCAHCYAETLSNRYGHDIWGPNTDRRFFGEKHWQEPLKWNRKAEAAGVRRRVFCGSMCDVFERHKDGDVDLQLQLARVSLWKLVVETKNLDWLLLTKRPENIERMLPVIWKGGLPDRLWLGVSIENAEHLWRIDAVMSEDEFPMPNVLFVSYEPALGPLPETTDLSGVNWLIYGGESGPGRRDDDDDWARGALDLCRRQGVAFFYKQKSGARPGNRPTLDGVEHHEFPEGTVHVNH